MKATTMPVPGERFARKLWSRPVTVLRSAPLGGRWGTGYVTVRIDDFTLSNRIRNWGWPAFKADLESGELMRITTCPHCDAGERMLECRECKGKGWIPATLTD